MEQQASKRNRMRVVSGQRRKTKRAAGFEPMAVTVFFSDKRSIPAILDGVDFGRITLRAEKGAWDESAKGVVLISSVVAENGDEIADGSWEIQSTRAEDTHIVISAKHNHANLISGVEALLSPETFLQTNRHRFFCLESDEEALRFGH